MSAVHVERFLSHLASERDVAASTQNQAKSALLFLYKEVLGRELPWLDGITQARVPKRLPVVLTRSVADGLRTRLDAVRALQVEDLAAGYGDVYLQHAPDRKYPDTGCGVASPLDGLVRKRAAGSELAVLQ